MGDVGILGAYASCTLRASADSLTYYLSVAELEAPLCPFFQYTLYSAESSPLTKITEKLMKDSEVCDYYF